MREPQLVVVGEGRLLLDHHPPHQFGSTRGVRRAFYWMFIQSPGH
jgi:hypothetical protein